MGKAARRRMASLDAQYRAVLGDQIPNAIGTAASSATPGPRRRQWSKSASCVTITRADGSVDVQPALTAAAARAITKERRTIPPHLRQQILIRDRGTCRYCGTTGGPFEIDHVIPVAFGGITHMRNLVTACRDCNQRKGARIWTPRPMRT